MRNDAENVFLHEKAVWMFCFFIMAAQHEGTHFTSSKSHEIIEVETLKCLKVFVFSTVRFEPLACLCCGN